jgi:polyhydroxybutyrate depolymerase
VSDCPPGSEVEFFILDGAGHTWAGSAFSAANENLVGPTNMILDATQTVWNFFQEHARP